MTNVAVVIGVVALGLLPAGAARCAEAPEAVKRSVRVAVGAGYVASLDDLSDDSDAGVALAVDFATHPSPAWRLGASLEFERYLWSGQGSPWADGRDALYTDERLFDLRLLGFLRFDPWGAAFVSPFVALGLGVARSTSSVNSIQCRPGERIGPAGEASLGVDVEVADALRVGVEGRSALAPFSGADCSTAYIPGEPPDPPEGFRHRLLLAVTFENPFW